MTNQGGRVSLSKVSGFQKSGGLMEVVELLNDGLADLGGLQLDSRGRVTDSFLRSILEPEPFDEPALQGLRVASITAESQQPCPVTQAPSIDLTRPWDLRPESPRARTLGESDVTPPFEAQDRPSPQQRQRQRQRERE